jgi:hypothetical protein
MDLRMKAKRLIRQKKLKKEQPRGTAVAGKSRRRDLIQRMAAKDLALCVARIRPGSSIDTVNHHVDHL